MRDASSEESAIAREERAKVARMPQRRKDFYLDGLVLLLEEIVARQKADRKARIRQAQAREALLDGGIVPERH